MEKTKLKQPRNVMVSRNSRGKQRGVTALEALAVIFIGVVVLGVAAAIIDRLFSNSDVAEETSNINQINTSTKQLKTVSGYGAANTNLTAQLIATKGIPSNMTVTGGQVYNTWGGTVNVTSNGPSFAISYGSVPQDACITLATKVNRGAFGSVRVNSGTPVTGEYTADQATSDCVSTPTNSVTYTSLR